MSAFDPAKAEAYKAEGAETVAQQIRHLAEAIRLLAIGLEQIERDVTYIRSNLPG